MVRDRSGWLVRRNASQAAEWIANRTWTGLTMADRARAAATADGYLILTGRSRDLIIRNGETLSPKEIKDALEEMSQLDEVSVVGLPDERTGEAVCATITLCAGVPAPSLTELQAHLAAKGLARQKWPDRVFVVPELPRNLAGKVRKEILRADILHRLAAATHARGFCLTIRRN